MSRSRFSTQDILEKGYELNKIYEEYKESGFNRKLKNDFYMASEQYRKEVRLYIDSNPTDIANAL